MTDGPFRIEFERHAQRELEQLQGTDRVKILGEVGRYLSRAPFLPIKTRIKRLSGFTPTLYRLRVGDLRVYYRIHQQRVAILAILHKKDAKRWLKG